MAHRANAFPAFFFNKVCQNTMQVKQQQQSGNLHGGAGKARNLRFGTFAMWDL